jgi:hypothetical protein
LEASTVSEHVLESSGLSLSLYFLSLSAVR